MEGEMELFSLQPILDSNELAELSKVFADEMDIFNRNQLIINTITKIDFRKFGELTEEMESNINRNIDYLYYMDYVQFDLETGKSPTDIEPEPPVQLTYEEGKTVQAGFEQQLEKQYQPIFELLEKAEPNAFESDDVRHAEIVDWKKKQILSEERLIEVKLKYVELMKTITDMKLSEKQRQLAEELKLNFKQFQVKAQLLKGIIDDTIRNQTKHASTAFHIVEGIIDEQLTANTVNS